MYVKVRMLFPCWMVVLLSVSAVWVSMTLVMVDIFFAVTSRKVSCALRVIKEGSLEQPNLPRLASPLPA